MKFPLFTACSIVLFTILSAAPVTAAPASSFLLPGLETRLRAGEDVRTASTGKDAALKLAPTHQAVADVRRLIAAESPDIIVEALFLWKKPHAIADASQILTVYNTLRAIGSLQGIEYFSASRGQMRLFYEYSSLIKAPDEAAPLPDTPLSAVPAMPETLFARQKDLSFGDNRYRITMSSGRDFVWQSSVNLTPMYYKTVVPVAGAEALNVRVLVIAADDSMIFYAVSSAKATVIPGVRSKLEASFGNRAAAVYTWFAKRLARDWPGR
jgi:hypothetical protein